ncbi:MAG: c-type cytochrome biogenesis protein CcsB [Deltaproteobacteria bacterium]|nr:c-type cytochrome biogenesis protein CcsB [Deltaproteobacteria bacterium]MBW1921086.1 c-type cytochrome biogenesis protein CcsB [Deltaproteobacteria bacterium]MBW1936798.1 c-type cytochrome biogenesis protein CcsB [Deltaproteobacteria bacterium]MBW1978582.1 c-type cytochrome biogenesis protein CcsB [Deltaproteobacteria bacterium]MBW2045766.1 c-type cytochrome biogenesis protein CcsB [Deltaproteobacteria bacterium]
MSSSVILSYITFVYFLSFLLYLMMMVMGKESIGRAATFVTLAGLAGQTFAIVLRWAESYRLGIGHAPLSNLYESLIFFAWTIIFLYLLTEWRTKNKSIGAFATPLAFLALAYASYSPSVNSRIQPLVPALKSNWLIAHVITCFFGYAAFGLAFGISIMYFLKKLEKPGKKNFFLRIIPRPAILDDLSYQMVVIGFLLLTLGIITGSVWAHSAWGSYWSWDPKETWSLITWLVYAALLHSRMIRGWRGNKLAILCIIGFSCVLFTYFGVNYLAGLHSYAQS